MSATNENHNFLVLISDEHRQDAMGCVGHPIVKTPKLAEWQQCGLGDHGKSFAYLFFAMIGE